jgi:imidazolonepropionase-like amidohydrolase
MRDETRGADLTIVNGLIFDGSSPELTEGSLTVADGRIVEIGAGRERGRVVDARGGTILPGLIDAHFHAYGVSLDTLAIAAGPLSYVALKGATRLEAALRRGFTTVRDVAGGDPGIAKAVAEGLFPSPRYLYTGPALSQTGGHGDPRPGDWDVCVCGAHMAEIVDGIEPLRRAVRDRFRAGAHAIKMMTSGGVVSPSDPLRVPQFSAEEIRLVTAEAGRRGSYVAAHAYSPEAILHSIDNGVRSIEHGNLLDGATAEAMAAAGAYLVPTLVTYHAMERRGPDLGLPAVSQSKNSEVLEAGLTAVETARGAGVAIGFGTDLMGPLQDEQLAGLRLQCEVDGILNTLRSATTVNAELLGRDDLGRICVGAVADLVVLPGNPLENPSVLWADHDGRSVIRSGRVV